MDQLRLILLIAGVLIIAGIYLWGMRKQLRARWERRQRQRARRIDAEPLLEDEALPDGLSAEPALDGFDSELEPVQEREPVVAAPENRVRETTALKSRRERAQEPAVAPEMTVLLTVMAPANRPFNGIDILEAAQATHLKLNRSGTLDCLVQHESGSRRLFRIAHLREPGVFRLEDIHNLTTPGLLLFLQLPGPLEPIAAVDRLIAIAGQLAEKLNGTVCDERRSRMTTQTMVHLRGQAADFDYQWQVWTRKQG